jgi:hypothetical protein
MPEWFPRSWFDQNDQDCAARLGATILNVGSNVSSIPKNFNQFADRQASPRYLLKGHLARRD